MVGFTEIFTLRDKLQEQGIIVPDKKQQVAVALSDEEILAEINDTLAGICTLDDYEMLVDVIGSIRDLLTLRFLYLFFQALVPVELRVWASCGMEPPFKEFLDDNIDLLLDEYNEYVIRQEEFLAGWARAQGYFEDEEKYAFIRRRNSIYANYVVLAGEIIGTLSS